MPTISSRAGQSTKHLSGAETKLREAVVLCCSTYVPFTDKTLTQIGEIAGMSVSQASTVMKSLSKKGEVVESDGCFYLLKLDDYQLEKIGKSDLDLLRKLVDLGCEEAKYALYKFETFLYISESSVNFLLHFFMFSNFTICKENFTNPKEGLYKFETNVYKFETPLKEYNDNVFLNDSLNFKEEEILKAEVGKTAAATETVFTDGDIPEKLSEKNKDIQEKLNGDKPDEDWAKFHTRTDLQPVDDWISYVQSLAECRNLTVRAVWERYLKDSGKKKKSATRYRFLKNWLWPDIQACPEEIAQSDIEIEEEYSNGRIDEREARARKRLKFNQNVDEFLRTKGIVQTGDSEGDNPPAIRVDHSAQN